MKIKILQFTIAASKGGRTQYILNVWNKIDKAKIQFDFVTFSKELDFEDVLIQMGCKVYHITHYPEDDLEGFIKEFSIVLQQNYDIIEVHTGYWKNTIVEDMAREYGVKRIIIHGHSTGINATLNKDDMIAAQLRHDQIKKRVNVNMATDYWVCSKLVKDWLFGNQIKDSKVEVLYNVIDTEKFKYREDIRNELRKKMHLQDSYVLGFAGRFEDVKNLTFLLELFKTVYLINNKSCLLLIGEGSQMKKLKEHVKSMNLKDAVCFMGRKNNVQDYLQVMDVFILPSFFEGFPLSLLEAQCAGLKCLCSSNITPEIEITKNIKRIPLSDKESWLQEIFKYMSGYIRQGCQEELKAKGFDTEVRIKELEKMYLGEEID